MTPASREQRPSWRDDALLGARMFVPLAISVSAYGLVWGVLAGGAGFSVWEVMLTSGVVFAGSAQFVALDLWTPAAALPIGALVVTALVINLRYVLMTTTMRPMFAGMPLRRMLPAVFLVTDETWALTMSRVSQGRGSVAFLVGAGSLAWVAWVLSTITGRLVGSAIDDPSRYGLDFAFVAAFLALLIGMWKGRSDLVPWLVAAAVATAASFYVPGKWYILIGGVVGSLVGAATERRRRVS